MSAAPSTACLWCERPCTVRRTPKQRFCSSGCRNAFHSGLRAYGHRAFDMGDVGIRELRELAGVKQPKG